MKNGFSDPEIEQAFISCLMQSPIRTFPRCEQYEISTQHFQTPQNRLLFDAISHFWREGKPLDLIAFTNRLRELGLLEAIGGASYVTETWSRTCHAPDEIAEYYAGIIAEQHAKRLIAVSCGEVLKEVGAPLMESPELVRDAVRRFEAIPVKAKKHRTLLEAMLDMVERIEHGMEAEDIIKTGINAIDSRSKLRAGDMPLIAGQRKSGKSIMALSIALNVAKAQIPVLIFSLEDKEPKVLERLVSAVARLPYDELRKSAAKMTQTIGVLSTLPIHIKDDCQRLESIESMTRELVARCGIRVVVVDYAQIVKVPSSKDTNREQKVAEVSRTLRLLAMETGAAIIVLSQLNADDQTRESRSLEQDCTACWWICKGKDDEENANVRFVRIPYQRNGPSDVSFKVTFLGAIARIENYAP